MRGQAKFWFRHHRTSVLSVTRPGLESAVDRPVCANPPFVCAPVDPVRLSVFEPVRFAVPAPVEDAFAPVVLVRVLESVRDDVVDPYDELVLELPVEFECSPLPDVV